MRIVTHKRIDEFSKKHNDAELPLNLWYNFVSQRDWRNINELRRDFNTIDYIGNNRFVFNIKGNSYRLIVKINYGYQIIWIRFIGTHKQYDKIDASNI